MHFNLFNCSNKINCLCVATCSTRGTLKEIGSNCYCPIDSIVRIVIIINDAESYISVGVIDAHIIIMFTHFYSYAYRLTRLNIPYKPG